jgi:hypothetical protein
MSCFHVDEKEWSILIPTFSNLARLRKDSQDCYPMFIALLQNYQLTFKKYVLEINVVFYVDL